MQPRPAPALNPNAPAYWISKFVDLRKLIYENAILALFLSKLRKGLHETYVEYCEKQVLSLLNRLTQLDVDKEKNKGQKTALIKEIEFKHIDHILRRWSFYRYERTALATLEFIYIYGHLNQLTANLTLVTELNDNALGYLQQLAGIIETKLQSASQQIKAIPKSAEDKVQFDLLNRDIGDIKQCIGSWMSELNKPVVIAKEEMKKDNQEKKEEAKPAVVCLTPTEALDRKYSKFLSIAEKNGIQDPKKISFKAVINILKEKKSDDLEIAINLYRQMKELSKRVKAESPTSAEVVNTKQEEKNTPTMVAEVKIIPEPVVEKEPIVEPKIVVPPPSPILSPRLAVACPVLPERETEKSAKNPSLREKFSSAYGKVKQFVTKHPYLTAGIGLGLIAGIGLSLFFPPAAIFVAKGLAWAATAGSTASLATVSVGGQIAIGGCGIGVGCLVGSGLVCGAKQLGNCQCKKEVETVKRISINETPARKVSKTDATASIFQSIGARPQPANAVLSDEPVRKRAQPDKSPKPWRKPKMAAHKHEPEIISYSLRS